jgi:hypothetical protein
MSFALVFEMKIINLVGTIYQAHEAYTQSHSDWDRSILKHYLLEVFREVSKLGYQGVQVLNDLFVQHPVLEQACSILAQNTPTAQDTRNTNFLTSSPIPP